MKHNKIFSFVLRVFRNWFSFYWIFRIIGIVGIHKSLHSFVCVCGWFNARNFYNIYIDTYTQIPRYVYTRAISTYAYIHTYYMHPCVCLTDNKTKKYTYCTDKRTYSLSIYNIQHYHMYVYVCICTRMCVLCTLTCTPGLNFNTLISRNTSIQ